jgi:hypothetical protein
MGLIEDFDSEDLGICPVCKKSAETKCTACKAVFYCSKGCQKKHWKEHKFQCKKLPYKVESSPLLGKYLVASRDLEAGEIVFSESPLVVGPVAVTHPICLACYSTVDGSYK